MNHKHPIKTYLRKPAKKPVSSLASVVSSKYNSVKNNLFDKSDTCNDSSNDPFETTFDRIAKGAVVPPMPLDNQNDSWKSSSDSDNEAISVKSEYKQDSNLFVYNNTSDSLSTNVSHKVARKRRKPKKYEPEVIIATGIFSKRTRIMSIKDKTLSGKAQGQKRQANKIKKKKMREDKLKSSRMCNEQMNRSHVIDNLEGVSYENGTATCNSNERLHQNVLKIDKTVVSQNESIRTSDFIANFKQIANYQQIIKPCFVKLNTCTVQNYILNCEKTVENKQDILHNAKFLYTDTLQPNKNISKIQNTISQSIPTEYNEFEDFTHSSVKQCSVVTLCNNVKDYVKLKSKRNTIDTIKIEGKSDESHLVFHAGPFEMTPNCNKSIKFAPYDKKKYKDLIKDSFVKVERLKIKEFAKVNSKVSNEKKQNIVCSTPLGKRVKPSSVLFSPINTNICDKLYWSQECSLVTSAKENISNIDLEDSHSLITMLEYHKLDKDIHEQKTQSLLLSQKSQMSIHSVVKDDVTSCKEVLVTQKYDTKVDNVETKIPYSLNMSIVSNDQSRSLFDDTTYSINHSAKSINGDNIKKKNSSDVLACKFIKMNTVESSVDLCLKQNQLLSDNKQTDASSQYKLPSKVSVFRDLDNMHMKQKYEFQENYHTNTNINTVEANRENFKNKNVNISKHNLLSGSQENINIDTHVLTRLQDPIRIGRRIQYPKWHLSMSNISDSVNNGTTQSNNEVFRYVTTDKNFSNVQSVGNSEYSKNVINLSHSESFNGTTQLYNTTNKQMEKSVFLKPGKYWARSLSILNNINDESNLDKLSIGKGKKWRRSVKDILDMQKQGVVQSCLKKSKDDTDLSNDDRLTISASNASSFNGNRCKEFNLTNNIRFSKRISVRVVLNNTSTKCDIKDTPFLEAFGITAEKSPSLKLSYREESLIHDDRIINSHSTTARDVVLQRCSQNCYISFADRFPDSYLEHCHKIGEGVYGEVFLYECDGKKSVIKIIPIENEQLVNGEQQKKFNEILSEIVIAKELDNLRLNDTYKTNGFVEVKNISCIIGKYPEKLIELWNIYDNNKTSDNDCPSMFGENQLYIALELSHGGEDLEAFVFQTAEEAYALFLQTALALAIAEKAFEFEHRDLHWGNVLISRTKEPYIYYNLEGREIKVPSKGVKVSIIDFTLSRMLYQGCCIYNDLALDPALFTAHGEYQFEIYRLMRDKIQNNWRKFEPYTNVLWLHYILDKMITAVRYKKKNLKVHKHAVIRLKGFKDIILNYDSAYDFVINSNSILYL
ncbi:PREDICTED: uncharacterized protein LOC105460437 isoform X2 [Wasmannia auropunctata]|uniref:uncharacterized protein LOC105460437 isoform X2 n=1 Tax=Wasmannia auropunctata TaxID=64793 RepID=UPI0005EEE1A6|nr:PREDICTED: uncharacterized protein LOC105460437 isoform X2 [Wasmannia auropunctata]